MNAKNPRWSPHAWARFGEGLRHLLVRGRVEAYVDGELRGARQARAARHIGRCWICGGHAETVLLIKRSLRARR